MERSCLVLLSVYSGKDVKSPYEHDKLSPKQLHGESHHISKTKIQEQL